MVLGLQKARTVVLRAKITHHHARRRKACWQTRHVHMRKTGRTEGAGASGGRLHPLGDQPHHRTDAPKSLTDAVYFHPRHGGAHAELALLSWARGDSGRFGAAPCSRSRGHGRRRRREERAPGAPRTASSYRSRQPGAFWARDALPSRPAPCVRGAVARDFTVTICPKAARVASECIEPSYRH